MDATLCDTVGSQMISNKRSKGGNAVSSLPGPLGNIAVKPQVPQASTIIRPNGDFGLTSVVESAGQGGSSAAATVTSVTTAAVNSPSPAELKPIMVLDSDISTASIHPPTSVPSSSSFISSSCFTDTVSVSPSLGWTSNADLSASRYAGRKAPSFVMPFRVSNTQNLLGTSSCLPTTSSCLPSSVSTTSATAAAMGGAEEPTQKSNEWQSSAALFQEILKRQEEQGYLDGVARRRVEAREKRRERREVRMAQSLGRIATALELLSSKQDTVIALLQRLADRK